MQHDCVEALAKQAPALAARNEELHLDTVDLGARHFDGLGRVDLNLVGMNAESQPVEQIDCELGISNGLRAAASTAPKYCRCRPYIGPAVAGDIELPAARTWLRYEELERARTALPYIRN